MESLAFANSAAAAPSWKIATPELKFCAQGCVKCSPVSLSLRSSCLSSATKSECSSAPTNLSDSSYYGDRLKAAEGPTKKRIERVLMRNVRAIFMNHCGSDNGKDADPHVGKEDFKSFGNGYATATRTPTEDFSVRGLRGEVVTGAPTSSANEKTPSRNEDVDELWHTIKAEARLESEKEPALASFFYSSVISHRSLERALAFHLSNKLSNATLLSTQLFNLIIDIFDSDAGTRRALREDLKAVRTKDPACTSYCQCLLYYKGFLACQVYRVAHWLWEHDRSSLAFLVQSRVSEVFHVDIHPAAKIGSGILFDHATGVVVGETATIGNNVSILHNVTLGGTGSAVGDRHPKIADGVLIGAGAILLGNIVIGEGAKIGSGSLVLINVPPHTTAVGNPARLVGGKQSPTKLKEIPSETMDHNIKGWSDYVI